MAMDESAIEIADVDLSLGEGAARVHILARRQPDNRRAAKRSA